MCKEILNNIRCSNCLHEFKEPFTRSEQTLAASKNRTGFCCICSNCKKCISVKYISPENKILSIEEVDLKKLVEENNENIDYHLSKETDEKHIKYLKKCRLNYEELIK